MEDFFTSLFEKKMHCLKFQQQCFTRLYHTYYRQTTYTKQKVLFCVLSKKSFFFHFGQNDCFSFVHLQKNGKVVFILNFSILLLYLVFSYGGNVID